MDSTHVRFPKNASGPFYTTGTCLACGAPEDEAPELLAPLTDENYDTYFIRQPSTPEEAEKACRAIEVCCVAALRYGGQDTAIIRRLGNRPAYCDTLLPEGPVRLPWESHEQWRAVRPRKWWQFWRTP